MKQDFFKPAARGLLALALLVASSAAMALGLGEIRVKSQPGQPLLAEIQVISGEPGELEQLRARLASPVIFERVGLPRPSGLISQLDFAVALAEDGKPVIRVTSQDPVDIPVVNFLIEVDWGKGRLVREYSALVGAPGAVNGAEAPQIQAPDPSPSNQIDRRQAPAAAPLAGQPDPSASPAAASSSLPNPDLARTFTVRQGQTLSQIARSMRQGASLDQTMIALLRANPKAFIGNNINLLRSGAVLRVPPASETAAMAAAEASAMVRQQVSEWRQARQTVPQPAGLPAAAASIPVAKAAPAVTDARLEIAPPVADAAQRAGTTSGTDAGGEGDMLLNEQLRQTKEDLAARSAEVQELRTQVSELEKLKAQQAQLIAMKDSDLAAAQKRLAQGQGEAGMPAWLWIGGLLVIVGLLAWVLLRRGRNERPAPVYTGALAVPPVVDSAMTPATFEAASVVPVVADPLSEPAAAPEIETPRYTPVYVSAESTPGTAAVTPIQVSTPAWMHADTAKPTWHTVDGLQPAPGRLEPTLTPTPADVAEPLATSEPAVTPEPMPARPQLVPASVPSTGGRERLELAIAYLDLGDTEAALSLLQQVAASDDPQARDEAGKLLRELG